MRPASATVMPPPAFCAMACSLFFIRPGSYAQMPCRAGACTDFCGNSCATNEVDLAAPMEGPPKIKPRSIDDYLEQLSKGVFQAGMSWRVVEAKWAGTRAAFQRFKVERIARMGDREIDSLATDTRLIRSRPKIAAVVHNARALLDLERAEGFKRHLGSFGNYEELATDLKKRFKFVGDSGAYHFLYTVSHPVPDWRDWAKAHGMNWGGNGSEKAAAGDGARAAARTTARREAKHPEGPKAERVDKDPADRRARDEAGARHRGGDREERSARLRHLLGEQRRIRGEPRAD